MKRKRELEQDQEQDQPGSSKRSRIVNQNQNENVTQNQNQSENEPPNLPVPQTSTLNDLQKKTKEYELLQSRFNALFLWPFLLGRVQFNDDNTSQINSLAQIQDQSRELEEQIQAEEIDQLET